MYLSGDELRTDEILRYTRRATRRTSILQSITNKSQWNFLLTSNGISCKLLKTVRLNGLLVMFAIAWAASSPANNQNRRGYERNHPRSRGIDRLSR